MDKAIVSGDLPPNEMSADELEEWYVDGTALLMMQASYAFAKPRHERWGVGTWSKAVQPSQIAKFGTETNKHALPPPSKGLSRQNRKKGPQKGATGRSRGSPFTRNVVSQTC